LSKNGHYGCAFLVTFFCPLPCPLPATVFFYYTVPKPIPSLKSHFVEPLRVIFGPYYGQKFLTYASLEEKKERKRKRERGRERGKKGGGEKEGT
ncbi:hypothetical protein O3Q49_14235, partial [Enterococcus lactis]